MTAAAQKLVEIAEKMNGTHYMEVSEWRRLTGLSKVDVARALEDHVWDVGSRFDWVLFTELPFTGAQSRGAVEVRGHNIGSFRLIRRSVWDRIRSQ